MKNLLIILSISVITGIFFLPKERSIAKNTIHNHVSNSGYINEKGLTIKDRILLPENFSRINYQANSFQFYIQNYSLKPFGSKVINYDGKPYIYQKGHVAVLEIPVPSNGLQQCADALIRIRAEFLWNINQKDKIGFNFTSGNYCSWKKYAEGYRPKINGNKVTFHKSASKNSTKENFYKYLNLIYMYSGTQSLFDELQQITSMEEVEVGDMLIYPGSPGHVIMVVDKAINSKGEKIFIFAQGNTPAQSVHIVKNPSNSDQNPWYDKLTLGQHIKIPIYNFNKAQFIRFKDI